MKNIFKKFFKKKPIVITITSWGVNDSTFSKNEKKRINKEINKRLPLVIDIHNRYCDDKTVIYSGNNGDNLYYIENPPDTEKLNTIILKRK